MIDNLKMKNIIHVADSYAKAKSKFNAFVQHCQSSKIKISFSHQHLAVRSSVATYRFISLTGNADQIKGLEIDKIVFDESSVINTNTKALLNSRLRNPNEQET